MAKEIQSMSFSELRGIKIGECVKDRGILRLVKNTSYTDGGGCGMGSYPAEVTVTLDDWTTYTMDSWSERPHVKRQSKE